MRNKKRPRLWAPLQNRTRTLVTRTGLGSATSPLWSWWYSKPRYLYPVGYNDTCQPQSYCIKNHKSPVWGYNLNSAVLRLQPQSHRLIRIIPILDIPTAPLVMHVCNLIHFLQRRLFALRAHGQNIIGVMLKYLGLLQASVAMINVDGHITSHYY